MAVDPKGNTGAGMEDFTGQKGVSKLIETGSKGMGAWLKQFKEILTTAEKLNKVVKDTADVQSGKKSGSGGSKLGAAEMGPGSFSKQIGLKGAQGFADEIGYTGTRGSAMGNAALGIMSAGSFAMSMMPNTMTAVSQRLVAEQIGMFSSGKMNPKDIIRTSNNRTGGAATSAGAPTAAMGVMLSGGYGFNSKTSQNLASRLGGVAAISGMSMESIAASTAGASGMSYLRLGVRLRDNNGNIRPYEQLVNEIYSKIWRTDPKTPELIFNKLSPEGYTLSQITAGDEGMYNILATMLVARAKNKKPITAKQLKNVNASLAMVGATPNSIMARSLNNQASANKLLGATESGLVSGYGGALDASTAVNNGLAGMAQLLPGVVDGLGKLKGFLETFPSTGNPASAISGAVSSFGGTLMAGKMLGVGGGGSKAAGTAGLLGKMGTVGKLGSITGLGLGIGGHFVGKGAEKGSGRSRAGNAMKFAGYASVLNFLGPEIGIPAMLAAGAIGAAVGGGENSQQPMNSSPNGTAALIAPGRTVSSAYGSRKDPNNRAATQHHNGIDYPMPVGSAVIAAADGVVDTIRTQPGNARSYGLYMVLKHEGFYTYYAHLSQTIARVGQPVKQGDVIAKSGGKKGAPGSGSSTGPHLHFEVRRSKASGTSVNPTSLFGKVKNLFSNIGKDNSPVDKSLYQAPTAISSASGLKSNPYSGTRLADLLKGGQPMSFQQMSNFSKMGATEWLDDHGQGSLLSEASAGSANNLDKVSGDSGGMAFGSRKGLMAALYNQGFRGKGLSTAFAVALAESGGMTRAYNNVGRDDSYGVFQINMTNKDPLSPNMGKNRLKQFGIKNNAALYDPNTNLRAAYQVSNKGTWWKQWATYNSGKFTNYLDDAELAARKAGVPLHYYGTDNASEGPAYLHQGEMVLNKQAADRLRGGLTGGAGAGCINVNMTVNIAKAGEAEVLVLLDRFKSAIAQDKAIAAMGVN